MIPFWVQTGTELKLAIVPRPRGGDWLEDEIRSFKSAGIDVVISMLEPAEAAELGLSAEATVCDVLGVVFRSFPVPDRETPQSTAAFAKFVQEVRDDLHIGRGVGVHCRASIGRSSLLLAAVLCGEGFPPEDAFKRLSAARGLQVPDTAEQIRWVERFALHTSDQASVAKKLNI